jgi:hypothetical protein
LKAGFLTDTNQICTTCHLRECARVGFDGRRIGDISRCFQGLNYTYIADFTGEGVIIPGFLLKGLKYPQNYRVLLRNGFELDRRNIDHLIQLFSEGGAIQNLLVDSERRGAGRALHDLKHLVSAMVRVVESGEIKRVTERYSTYSASDVELMRTTIISVYNILGVIKNQIDMSDFILTPNAFEFSQAIEMDIFPLFDKNVHIYRVLAAQDNKTIEIEGRSGYIRGKRIVKGNFAMLQAILLENFI